MIPSCTVDAHNGRKAIALARNASRGASYTSPTRDVLQFDGWACLVVTSGGGSGGTPTLAVVLQQSANGSSWSALDPAVTTGALGAGACITAVPFDLGGAARYLRVVSTQGAGSTFIWSAHLVATPKST